MIPSVDELRDLFPGTGNQLLIGGGLDSVALFFLLREAGVRFQCRHYDYGQIASAAELEAAQRLCFRYRVPLWKRAINSVQRCNPGHPMFIKSEGALTEAYLDGRNLILGVDAASDLPFGSTLIYGFVKEENQKFTDANQKFVDALNVVLALSFVGRKVQASAPLASVEKLELVKAVSASHPEFWDMSMTCWTPVKKGGLVSSRWTECRDCGHCRKKQELRARCEA